MGILQTYLYKEFVKLFALCQGLFTFLYLFIDFTQRIDDLLEAHVPKPDMVAYFYYKIPYVILHMAPAATLISVIVLFNLMRKNNEITALRGCGMSLYELSRPLIFLAFLIAVFMFLFSELLVPYASSKSNAIWNSEVKKSAQRQLHMRNDIWYKSADSIYWIGQLDVKRQVIKDLSLYFFDNAFRVRKKIDAQRATWTGTKWRIEEGIIQNPGMEGGSTVAKFDRIYLNVPEEPELLGKPIKKPDEMGYWQLKRYAAGIEAAGYDATSYLVDLNIKLSFPLINLVVLLIGIPIAVRVKKGGTPQAVSLGIGACLLFLIVLGVSRSFGLSGFFPPVISAWFTNVLFSLIGIYLMIRVDVTL